MVRQIKSPEIKKEPPAKKGDILEHGRRVVRVEAEALRTLEKKLDDNFCQAVELLHAAEGRVIITGIGKSGIVGKKIAGTFTSLG